MAVPLIDPSDPANTSSGIAGRFQPAHLIWSDEFNGTQIKRDRWRDERLVNDRNGQTFTRALAQTNVGGHNDDGSIAYRSDGSVDYNVRPQGKRHAIWYDKHREDVQYVENGKLVLGGKATNEIDQTIDTTSTIPGTSEKYHPYIDNRQGPGTVIDFSKKIYGSWINTYAAMEDPAQFNKKVIDPQSPRQIFRYGFYEFDIDLSGIQPSTAYRVSAWLMPACKPTTPDDYEQNKTYDGNPASGAEIDLFEYENSQRGSPPRKFNQLLLMKVIAGLPTQPATSATEMGFDLRTGVHTIGLWWKPDGLYWFLNGKQANVDTQQIPKIGQAFFFTREGNSCLDENSTGSPQSYPPIRQKENGWLYGDNIGADPQKINDDKARIGYLRIWQDPSLNGPPENDNTNWRHEQTFGKIDPDTPGADQAGGGGSPGTGVVPAVPGSAARKERSARLRYNFSVVGDTGYWDFFVDDPAAPADGSFNWDISALAGRGVVVGSDKNSHLRVKVVAAPSVKQVADVTVTY